MEAIARNTLAGSLQSLCEVAVVISNRRDAPGLDIAESLGIPVEYIESKGKSRKKFEEDLLICLASYSAEYIVLAGFMRILTGTFISHYPKKIINIHPADTVEHQGVDGYQWAFEQGLEETKITVHFVDEGIDTGEVIAKVALDLRGVETLEDTLQKGLQLENQIYSTVLEKLFSKSRLNVGSL